LLLQLLSERRILDRLAFKGGTSCGKCSSVTKDDFSTDLDFTGIEEARSTRGIILDMMQRSSRVYHGIQFRHSRRWLLRKQDGLSWASNPNLLT